MLQRAPRLREDCPVLGQGYEGSMIYFPLECYSSKVELYSCYEIPGYQDTLGVQAISCNVVNFEENVAIREETEHYVKLFICIFGLTIHLLFVITMIRARKTVSKLPFFKIVWNMVLVDTIYFIGLMSNFLVVFVETRYIYYNTEIYEYTKEIYRIGILLESLNEIAIRYVVFLVSFNRFATFIVPKIAELLFSASTIYRTLIVSWIVTTARLFAYVLTTDEMSVEFTFVPEIATEDIRESIDLVMRIFDYVVLGVSFVAYFFVFNHIHRQPRVKVGTTSASKHHREIRMLYQAFIITVVLVASDALKTVLESRIRAASWMTTFIVGTATFLSVSSHAVHGIIFILTNLTIREHIPGWRKKHPIKIDNKQPKTVRKTV